MLPVFKAISLKSIIEKGGHTKPWVVSVKTNDSQHSYVVKLYTSDQISSRNSVTGEVICNKLAKHFLLNSPQAALIEFDEDFRMKLGASEQVILDGKDDRIKFGTLLLESDFMFTSGLPKKTFQKNCSAGLDTLFAFDNLIRNADRGSKPNILFSDSDTWVIDHEMAFEAIEEALTELNDYKSWKEKFYKYHICYTYLKRAKKETKLTYFNDFTSMLMELRINTLTPYFNQLEQYGYDTNFVVINNYLSHINKNYRTFETLLKHLVS